jgi:hypothetical protein
MPAVGLYFVARQQQPGQEAFRFYALPTAPPKDPFAIRASATCTGQAHDLATQFLNELKNHFATGAATPSWTIVAHTAKAGTWYELNAGDVTVIPAVIQCGRIAAPTPDDLSKRGFDGKPIPALNYAPSLGLYLLRPTPRPSPSP